NNVCSSLKCFTPFLLVSSSRFQGPKRSPITQYTMSNFVFPPKNILHQISNQIRKVGIQRECKSRANLNNSSSKGVMLRQNRE
ncbi:hypothetical protein VIGAN_02159000, partial [Vigna angularis var. angularis]